MLLNANTKTVRNIWIFIVIGVCSCSGHNDFFMVNRYDPSEFFCFTNSSFALSWIIQDTAKSINLDIYASRFLPERNYVNFTGDLTNWKHSKGKILNDIVLDRRWEKFPVIKADYVENDEQLIFSKINVTLTTADFNIPFSVRAKQDAQLFLCDGEEVAESNCYWFILQGFGATKSILRRCSKGMIPQINNHKVPDTCREQRASSNDKIINNIRWSHFKISKKSNSLTLRDVDGNNILSYTDSEGIFTIKNVFVHTKKANSLWKFHTLDNLYTETMEKTLVTDFIISDGYFCVSMFVKMCNFCKVKGEFKVDLNETLELMPSSERQISDWTEIKFIRDNLEIRKGTFYIITQTEKGEENEKPYWSVSDIRQCSKSNFRLIRSQKEADCQLISKERNVIEYKVFNEMNMNSENQDSTKCKENEISKFCIPCSHFQQPKCGKMKICEKFGNTVTCSCSSGYQPTSNSYYCSPCPERRYGHQCNKKCSEHCAVTCDSTDGTCNSCKNNYYGPKCEQPPLSPPLVQNVSYYQAEIKINSTEWSSFNYTIQFRRAKAPEEWTTVTHKNSGTNNHSATLYNLTPGVEYFVRSVPTEIRSETASGFSRFCTICDDINSNLLLVNPSNTSAVIKLDTENKPTICPADLQVRHLSSGNYSVKQQQIIISNLEPFQEYSIAILANNSEITKSFRTTEGTPGQIRNLDASVVSSTKVHVWWNPPSKFNGPFVHYVLKFWIKRYLSCDSDEPKKFPKPEMTITNKSVEIGDLTPYAEYEFLVASTNGKFRSLFVSKTVDLPSSDQVLANEISKIGKVETETRSVKFYLIEHCSNIRGPLNISATTTCLSEWCKNNTNIHIFLYKPSQTYTLNSGILPFTEYTLELKFCRNDNICKKLSEIKRFKTQTELPYAVRNFSLYSKNDHSLSFRWKPPHPPTGTLEGYTITYSTESEKFMKNVINSVCKLWPNYQCTTINNLTANASYSIQIQAKNKEKPGLGGSVVKKYNTRTEPARRPPKLDTSWSLQNDLVIKWEHPEVANGDISKFDISVLPFTNASSDKDQDIRRIINVSEDQYMSTYHETVKADDLLPLTIYKIKVSAYNGYDGEEAVIKVLSPPEIPSFEYDPKIEPTNKTIAIEIPKIKNKNNENKYKLFVLLFNDKTKNKLIPPEIKAFDEKFQTNLQKFQIAYTCEKYKNRAQFIIGENSTSPKTCQNESNISLIPGTYYNITILLMTTTQNKSSYHLYSHKILTMGKPPGALNDLSLLALLVLLLIIPLAVIIYIKRSYISEKINSFRKNTGVDTEALQETTPLATPKAEISTKTHSKRVKVSNLEQYVKESLKTGELERQHALFPRGQTQPWERGALKENKSKNRYTNLIAYDHTRVVLSKLRGKEFSDYINASYIDGYGVSKAYIATQGPKMSTVDDFWRMIWQERVQHIVMLANVIEGGKKKVEMYWPEPNKSLPFGGITVHSISSQVFTDYEHRVFKMEFKTESRRIHQYHFSSWPDHGVPLYSQSLIPLLRQIQNIPLDSKSPIVVHCSAGVGRTGTVLLCDSTLRMAAKENAVDLLHTLQKLREQRPNMVDNIQQYKLAHLVVLEYLLGMKTGILCNELEREVDELVKNGGIKKQMEYLVKTAWQDDTMKSAMKKNDNLVVVKAKNRVQSIVPDDQNCTFLSRYPISDESSTYINAVNVDGFQSPNRFIVTQQPLPNTVGDFWRLIHEKDVSVIISLNEIDLNNKTCCRFYPSKTEKELKPTDYLTLRYVKSEATNYHKKITMNLHCNNKEDHRVVEIMALKNWPAKTNRPKKLEDFLNFWEESKTVSIHSNPVVVTCFDGALASGLYTALSFVIEKINLEQICDVCQAVRTVRHSRAQFVQNEEQFEFLYRAAVTYIQEFQTYANFN